jgi:hypothetical protein
MNEGNQQPSQMSNRLCKDCGETKSLVDFPMVDREKPHIRRHFCKPCNAARTERWRQANYERWRSLTRKHAETRTKPKYRILRRAIVAAYGGGCSCCSERTTQFLAIDHVNNDGGKARGAQHPHSGLPFLLWIIDNNFPDTLRVLCHNCNMGRQFNGGICPHLEGSEAIPKGSTVKATVTGSALRPRSVDDDMVRSQQKC